MATVCKTLVHFLFLSVFCISNSFSTGSFLKHFGDSKFTSNVKQIEDGFRLPPNIFPINYRLEFLTILDPLPGYETFTAPAKAWITIGCQQDSFVITMHSINLTINDGGISVRNIGTGTNIRVSSVSYTTEYDFLHIELTSAAEVGQEYEIYIEFITPISSDRLNGMYLDFYDDMDSGERNYIATTLFAPFHTRRAFPSFDEPSFRASYEITVGHHTKYHSMSNTEIISSRPIENMTDWEWDTFEKTPSMSSYIVAVIVSNLEFFQAPQDSFRNVSVRVYAKPESIKQGAAEYSALLTGAVMTYYESLFIVKYPISKIYSVALPKFFFSAMENWGLITYKEPILLYIPGESSEEDRYIINYVLSHEKAHQHFGNIVACKWWAYVWLKEGFSTYYSHYGMNHTNPELNPWERFIPKILQVAMEFDASNETHPLENFPPTSAAVADIYTSIPYQKGASFLRMASSILTEPVFLSAIRDYVDTFQYQSATQYDVFEAMQRAVDASPEISSLLPTSVGDIMNTWTTQAGFPVLKVKVLDSNRLEISQKKFIDGDTSNPSDTTWWVPVFTSPRPNPALPSGFPDAWIPQGINTIVVNMPTNQTILINPSSIGYYKVLYDSSLLQTLQDKLTTNHLLIEPVVRSQLLNDYYHFAMTGLVDIETTLELTGYLNKEINHIVWQGVHPLIEKLDKILIDTEYHELFKNYFGKMVNDALTLLEESNSDLEKGEKAMLHNLLMNLACKLISSTKCLEKGKSSIMEWMTNPNENLIPVNTQEALFCGAVQGTQDEDEPIWNFLYSKYKEIRGSGKYSPISLRLIKGMTCTKNELLLKTIFQMVINEASEIPDADKHTVLSHLVDNPVGKDLIFNELEKSSDWLIKLFKSRGDLRSFMKITTSYILPEQSLEMLRNLAESAAPSFKRTILTQVDGMNEKIKSIYFIQSVSQWLATKV